MHILTCIIFYALMLALIGWIMAKTMDGVIALLVHTWPWWPLVPAALIAWWAVPPLFPYLLANVPEWVTAIGQAAYQAGVVGCLSFLTAAIILVGGWTWVGWRIIVEDRSRRRPRAGRHSPVSRRPTAQPRCQSC